MNTFKKSIERAILHDPHKVTIYRTTKKNTGKGYMETVKETLPTQIVRIYPIKSDGYRITDQHGTQSVDRHYRLLGLPDLDIQADPKNKDLVESILGVFEVLEIYPYTRGGLVVGLQADLKRVSRDAISNHKK